MQVNAADNAFLLLCLRDWHAATFPIVVSWDVASLPEGKSREALHWVLTISTKRSCFSQELQSCSLLVTCLHYKSIYGTFRHHLVVPLNQKSQNFCGDSVHTTVYEYNTSCVFIGHWNRWHVHSGETGLLINTTLSCTWSHCLVRGPRMVHSTTTTSGGYHVVKYWPSKTLKSSVTCSRATKMNPIDHGTRRLQWWTKQTQRTGQVHMRPWAPHAPQSKPN